MSARMTEQDMLDYLKAERERMEAATFFCPACNNWQLKASHLQGGPAMKLARYAVRIFDGRECGHHHRSKNTAQQCARRYAALSPRIVRKAER